MLHYYHFLKYKPSISQILSLLDNEYSSVFFSSSATPIFPFIRSIVYYLLTKVTLLLFFFLTATAVPRSFGQAPPGFTNTLVAQFDQAVGVTFNNAGTDMFVWERAGRVWVIRNGVRSVFIDIREEVGAYSDHGLLGFALHPQFETNGYFYLLYNVDRHYLLFFGTPGYNSSANIYDQATIGRLTRYRANRSPTGVYTVDLASRNILIGATRSTGIPNLSETHGVGSLCFGTDGSLLISAGEGASPQSVDIGSNPASYFQAGLSDGIIPPEQNVGAFRAQQLESYNGKILRIDPLTGNGIPSNPFYETANPGSVRSKVWALGLRNPYRMSVRPGSGSLNPADGQPGIIYLGDVGWDTFEELNVVTKGGQNLGWPLYEGLTPELNYQFRRTLDQYRPNPLYNGNTCSERYFAFHDLIKQETASGSVSLVNPCDGITAIPTNVKTFMHTRPVIDWRHATALSRTGTFNGETATETNIGAAGSPVSGPQFIGNCALGGVFYPHADFPPEYQNAFFFGDFAGKWIKSIKMNGDKPAVVQDFIGTVDALVAMATNPVENGLYYITFSTVISTGEFGNISSELRKLAFTNTNVSPPVAVASSDKKFGPSPLVVQFTGSNSSDPNGQQLTYLWNFGDGTTSTVANPSHTYTTSNSVGYTVSLTVRNSSGLTNTATVLISVNNTAPVIVSMTPMNGTLYPITGQTPFTLQANVTDNEQAANALSYRWETFLHHDNHQHPDPIVNTMQSTLTTAPYGCGTEDYYYRIRLTVTDAAGASSSRESNLYPYCSKVVSFDLINATNGQVLQPLTNGATVDVKSLPTDKLNIRANTTADPLASLVFNLSGKETWNTIDGTVPYSAFDVPWTPPAGNSDYTLNGTPYAGSAGSGTNGTPLTISFSTSNGTIQPNVPNLTVSDVIRSEGNNGTSAFSFTVNLSLPAPAGGVSFDIATADGTAIGASDYVSKALTSQTIPAGATTYTFDVIVNGDIAIEPDETFFVNVSNVTGAMRTDGQGIGTIDTDDGAVMPNLTINDVSQTEGNSKLVFTVTLSSPAPAGGVTFDIATANGTAIAPGDFTQTTITSQTIPSGSSIYTFEIPVRDDASTEPDETFSVNISNVIRATITDGQGVGTILNDDGVTPPYLSIDNVTQAEGNTRTSVFNFTVTLSALAPAGGVSFTIATQDNSATAGSDYIARSISSQTIPAGSSTYTFAVTVNGDNLLEPDETFAVNVTNVTGAVVAPDGGSGIGTIQNDDAASLPNLTITNVSQAEGNSGTSTVTFTVNLSSPAPTGGVAFSVATVDGTATAGIDYVALNTTGSISAGNTSTTVAVTVNGDNTFEANETFNVNIGNVTNAVISDGTGLGTINNDDALPNLTITDVSQSEGNSSTSTFTFTVSLSAPAPTGGVTFNVVTSNGTATAGIDYVALNTTGSIAAGNTSTTVAVIVTGDIAVEPNETFSVIISNATNATVTDGTGAGIITNDDAVPNLSIADVSQAEGNTGISTFTFNVSLSSPAPAGGVTFNVVTANGTATAGTDYVALNTTGSIAAGNTSTTVVAVVNGDLTFEPNETFTVTISNSTNAVITDGIATGTITNDDALPNLSINNVTQAEGNLGTSTFTFTVSLSAPAPAGGVTFNVATANGTATAGSDYVTSNTTGLIAAGSTSTSVVVRVNGDNTVEIDETFSVNITSPANAVVTNGTGTGTITNDDAVSNLTITDVTLAEGNSGTANFTFTVSLSAPAPAGGVSFNVATANVNATAGSDYAAVNTSRSIAAGSSSTTIVVSVNGDLVFEGDETFTVNITNPTNAVITDGIGQGTITNDDALPNLSINDVTQTEGNATSTFTFNVSLSAPAPTGGVTFNVATANGTATAGSDYVALNTTGTIAAGSTSTTVVVTINGDNTSEPNETFAVNITNITNGVITDGAGLGTITNDDGAALPGLSITDISQAEGNSGTSNFTFTVNLSAPAPAGGVSFNLSTTNGTATAGSDYVASSGPRSIPAGGTSTTIVVAVNGDLTFEANETFTVNITSPTNAVISDGVGLATINNDDALSNLTITDVTQAEGNAGTTTFSFTVNLSAPAPAGGVTFSAATANGTATAGSDYVAVNTTGTIAAGNTSTTVAVTVNGDNTAETNETFTVNISNPANAVISDGVGLGTITNDDATSLPNLTVTDVTQPEGQTGTSNFNFTVNLSAPAPAGGVSFNVTTANGTATAGSDYLAQGTPGTIAAGNTSATVIVTVISDNVSEANETFTVNISSVNNATIGDGVGLGTITNDDSDPCPTDQTPPTIITRNITINLDATGNASILPADVIQSITDNCAVNNSSIQVSQSSFSCSDLSTSPTTSYLAYRASTTIGAQAFDGELGMEFTVNNPGGIVVKQLGAFDHQGNGITGSVNGGIRVAIFNKATRTIVPGLDATIIGLADQYVGNHRMRNVSPVTLPVGNYVIVTKGYNASELNGNLGQGSPITSGDNGNGAISYTGTGLYGLAPGFNYPENPDAGPANRYIAGTFNFELSGNNPLAASYLAYRAGTTIGAQAFDGELGMEFTVNNPGGIVVKQLGAFDHQGNGITGSISGGIRVAIFNKTTRSIVPGLDIIISGLADQYVGNHRMRNVSAVTLPPGNYVIVTKGYNATELNGNLGQGSPISTGDNGNGAISFTGTGLYGLATGFNYPENPDAGPANRYIAGTFNFELPGNNPPAASYLAYRTSTTTGTQVFDGELGMEFTVNNPGGIVVKQLGAFDHQGNGITGSINGGIRVAIFNKATRTIVPGLDATITGLADQYVGNHRMRNVSPVTLPPGNYVIVTKGYNSTELNGNLGEGSPITTGDNGNGAISYTGTGLYGLTPGFNYPENPDAGPANRYIAGTFQFEVPATSPPPTGFLAYRASTTTGAQAFDGELGMEFTVNNPGGIVVNQLGAFDHQGNGITGSISGGIRVAIFNRATRTIVPGLDAIVSGLGDQYVGNHRMKTVSAVTLPPGNYVIVTKGYNATELNGNLGQGSPITTGDNGNGAISYTGTGLYGLTPGFNYPENPDAGPANRYIAGTFQYTIPGGGGGSNSKTITITAMDTRGNLATSTATVTIADPSGACGRAARFAVLYEQAAPNIAVAVEKAITLKAFPNPSDGRFTVQILNLNAKKVSIQVLNVQGNILQERSINVTGGATSLTEKFDLFAQPSGVYFVKVISADGVQISKVVLQH